MERERTPVPTPTERPLFGYDFEAVCRRGVVEKAAPYDAENGEIHPVLVFQRQPDRDGYSEISPTTLKLPVPWMVEHGEDYSVVELVACLTAVDATFVKTCDYESRDTGDTILLHLHNTTYEAVLYAAQTGEVIATSVIEAESDVCPLFTMTFSEKKDEEPRYAYPSTGDLQTFLEPFVEP